MQIAKLSELKRFSPEKFQKVGVFDSQRMFCDIYCLRPGQSQQLHKHEESDKVYYVLEGKGIFTVGKEELQELQESEVESGKAVFAPASHLHGVKNNSDSNLVLLVFMAPKPHH